MKPLDLRSQRLKKGWTQPEAARRLGVSQPYLAMLESGERRLTPALARKAMRVYRLAPTVLPLATNFVPPAEVDAQRLADDLAALGYPGFQYLRSRVWRKNPAEVLLSGLSQNNLEARLVEALFWLPLHYWNMDASWLVEQAKRHNLQNRLGFVVSLARRLSERSNPANEHRNRALAELEVALDHSRLDREDDLFRVPRSDAERAWLVDNRTDEAKRWKVLTDWRLEHLQYVA